jgi:DNA-binding Lrp family transcriptional regulator
MSNPETRTSAELVYDTIKDLQEAGRIPTREVIVEESGLRFTVVDEQIKRLRDDGRIRKVVNGVFELMDVRQDRAISSTITASGLCKLDIGDQCLELSRSEARKIAQVLGGFAFYFGR